ncbi:MAG: hypothetical protein ACRYG5_16335 [Janthinobacterium lividum]
MRKHVQCERSRAWWGSAGLTKRRMLLPAVVLSVFSVTWHGPFAQAADLPAGTVLVLDNSAGTDLRGALYAIHPKTRVRRLISDLGDSRQGVLAVDPVSVSLLVDPLFGLTIYVADAAAGTDFDGAILTIDPSSGRREMLSDFGDLTKGRGVAPSAVVGAPGLLGIASTLIATDPHLGALQHGEILYVDPRTGYRVRASDGGATASGPLTHYLNAVNGSYWGAFFVTDQHAGTDGRGGVLRVEVLTQKRTLLSDFGDRGQGPLGNDPLGLALVPDGLLGWDARLFVLDADSGSDGRGAIFTVNLSDGQRVLLSDLGDPLQGPLGEDPAGLAFAASLSRATGTAQLLMLDRAAGRRHAGKLILIDAHTGTRTTWSDFNDAPLDGAPTALTIR